MQDEPEHLELKEAIENYVTKCKNNGEYMPAIATLLRIYADELADRYPDDTNGGNYNGTG